MTFALLLAFGLITSTFIDFVIAPYAPQRLQERKSNTKVNTRGNMALPFFNLVQFALVIDWYCSTTHAATSHPRAINLFVTFSVMGVYFYYVHRAFHKLLWRFHQIHHSYVYLDVSRCAAYTHPVEQALLNTGSVLCGLYTASANYEESIIVALTSILFALLSHTNVPMLLRFSSRVHIQHHEFPNRNFGNSLGILDRLHGTTRE